MNFVRNLGAFTILMPGLIALSCSQDSNSIAHIDVVSLINPKMLRFEIINNTNEAICISSLFTGGEVGANIFRPMHENSDLAEMADVEDKGHVRPVSVGPGASTQIVANIKRFYDFQKSGDYEFDVSIPTFPCDSRSFLGVTREWEEAFGPNYQRSNGLRFPRSSKFKVVIK